MKTSRHKQPQSVYRNQNVLLRTLFEREDSARKVLCVALDYAKSKHVALCCDGHGEILKAPFPVENNPQGVDYLCEQVAATARRRRIRKHSIFFGGEDEPSYVANFTAALRGRGYLVVRVNAFEASEQRESLLASTDNLDLLGIAKTLISRRARLAGQDQPGGEIYRQLRELCRCRRGMVRQITASSNRIHTMSDELLPGFLNSSKSGITPFTGACLALLKDRFSAPQIARRPAASLANLLRRHHVHHAGESAAKLRELASSVLPPRPGRVVALQRTLCATVDLYECLDRNAAALRAEAALLLARTPYVMLTSIAGIGMVLAAGAAGELGAPGQLPRPDSLCAYAGIVPGTLQTGGPDQAACQGHTRARCNRVLKDWTVQSAQKISLYGPPELRDRITRWQANGQHAAFAAARRYLRLLHALVTNQVPYLAPAGRGRGAHSAQITAACQDAWQLLMRKWRPIPGGLEAICADDSPLGIWRRVVMELHHIHLSTRP
jgi:transposase